MGYLIIPLQHLRFVYMKISPKKIVLSIVTLGSFAVSSVAPAFAADPTQGAIDVCPSGTFGGVCNTSVNSLISNVIQGVFVIAILIALFFLIWGGLSWIISQGNKEKVTAARNTLIAALVGLIVVFLSYFLLNVVIQLLFGKNVTQVLNSVTSNGIFNNNPTSTP